MGVDEPLRGVVIEGAVIEVVNGGTLGFDFFASGGGGLLAFSLFLESISGRGELGINESLRCPKAQLLFRPGGSMLAF